MMDPEGIAEEGIMIIMLWPLSSHLRPGLILTNAVTFIKLISGSW